jgi:hypothetical protein
VLNSVARNVVDQVATVKRILLFLLFVLLGSAHATAAAIHSSENRIWEISKIGYDAPSRTGDAYDGSSKSSSTYDVAPSRAQTDSNWWLEGNRDHFTPFGRLLAASRTLSFTFRGDSRAPSTIFDEGFSARGTSTDLFAHALDNTRPPSAFISTSRSADVAAGFSDNVFVLRPRNGIDVNRALGPRSPFPDELEIAIPWRVDPSDIRGVTLPNEGFSILNPNFTP